MFRTAWLCVGVVVTVAVAGVDAAEEGAGDQAFLGVHLQRLEPELAEALGMEEAQGALIADVVPESPAQRIGLRAGDVIVEVDGKTVEGPEDVVDTVRRRAPGDEIRIAAVREGGRFEVAFPLGGRDAESDLEPRYEGSRPRTWTWRWEGEWAPDMPWKGFEPPEGPWRGWRGFAPPESPKQAVPWRFEGAPRVMPPGFDEKAWERQRDEMERTMRRLLEEYAGKGWLRRPAPGHDEIAPHGFEELESRIEELEERFDALQGAAEELKGKLGERLEALRGAGGEYREQLQDRLRQMHEELRAQLEARVGALDRQERHAVELGAEVQRLREENEALRRESEMTRRALEEISERAKQQQREHVEQMERLREEMRGLAGKE